MLEPLLDNLMVERGEYFGSGFGSESSKSNPSVADECVKLKED